MSWGLWGPWCVCAVRLGEERGNTVWPRVTLANTTEGKSRVERGVHGGPLLQRETACSRVFACIASMEGHTQFYSFRGDSGWSGQRES